MPRSNTLRPPKRRGIVLIVALFFMFLLALIGTALIGMVPTEVLSESKNRLDTQAHYAALGGIQHAKSWITYVITPETNTANRAYLGDSPSWYNASFTNANKIYNDPMSAPDGGEFECKAITAVSIGSKTGLAALGYTAEDIKTDTLILTNQAHPDRVGDDWTVVTTIVPDPETPGGTKGLPGVAYVGGGSAKGSRCYQIISVALYQGIPKLRAKSTVLEDSFARFAKYTNSQAANSDGSLIAQYVSQANQTTGPQHTNGYYRLDIDANLWKLPNGQSAFSGSMTYSGSAAEVATAWNKDGIAYNDGNIAGLTANKRPFVSNTNSAGVASSTDQVGLTGTRYDRLLAGGQSNITPVAPIKLPTTTSAIAEAAFGAAQNTIPGLGSEVVLGQGVDGLFVNNDGTKAKGGLYIRGSVNQMMLEVVKGDGLPVTATAALATRSTTVNPGIRIQMTKEYTATVLTSAPVTNPPVTNPPTTVLGSTTPGTTAPRVTNPPTTVLGNTTPGTTAPRVTNPPTTVLGNTTPGTTAPRVTNPATTTSVTTVMGSTTPAQTLPPPPGGQAVTIPGSTVVRVIVFTTNPATTTGGGVSGGSTRPTVTNPATTTGGGVSGGSTRPTVTNPATTTGGGVTGGSTRPTVTNPQTTSPGTTTPAGMVTRKYKPIDRAIEVANIAVTIPAAATYADGGGLQWSRSAGNRDDGSGGSVPESIKMSSMTVTQMVSVNPSTGVKSVITGSLVVPTGNIAVMKQARDNPFVMEVSVLPAPSTSTPIVNGAVYAENDIFNLNGVNARRQTIASNPVGKIVTAAATTNAVNAGHIGIADNILQYGTTKGTKPTNADAGLGIVSNYVNLVGRQGNATNRFNGNQLNPANTAFSGISIYAVMMAGYSIPLGSDASRPLATDSGGGFYANGGKLINGAYGPQAAWKQNASNSPGVGSDGNEDDAVYGNGLTAFTDAPPVAFFGGLIEGQQKVRGSSAVGGKVGWGDAFTYDQALANKPPPYFPTNGLVIPLSYVEERLRW
jgi:hypothetical protein